MPVEKRNAYLDAEESDDDADPGYDSEKDELVKGRSSKRRKLELDASSDDDAFSDDDASRDVDETSRDEAARPADDTDARDAVKDDTSGKPRAELASEKAAKEKAALELPGVSKLLGKKKNLVVTDAAVRRSGVVFISRVPPFMKPDKMRSLLAPYGQLNRVYLAPEDPAAHTRRVRGGGNKKRSWTEGWVEFCRKDEARRACELLNARTIGGKKGSYYRDDVWSMLYLRGFKWHHLTEQIAAENAERAARMRAEISRTTRENKDFVRNVERAKMLDGMQAKRDAKGKGKDKKEVGSASMEPAPEHTRTFKQIPLVKKNTEQAEQVQRVLSKIF